MKNWKTWQKVAFWAFIVLIVIAIYMNWNSIYSLWKPANTRQFRVGGSVGGFTPIGVVTPGSNQGNQATSIPSNQVISNQNISVVGQYNSCDSILERINFIKLNYRSNIGQYVSELESLKAKYNSMNCSNYSVAKKGGAACEAWLYCPSGCHQLFVDCFGK